MGTCKFCGKEDKQISLVLQACRKCILNYDWDIIKPHVLSIHKKVRKQEGLPENPPQTEKSSEKFKCNLCINECSLSGIDTSYCGLRNLERSRNGDLPFPSKSKGYIHGYLDPNPTNCCAAWFCPAGTSYGYPKYSDYEGPEYGTYNYAAFLYGCTFDCLFCQNASHKRISKQFLFNVDNLTENITENKKITCLCYFGGTPEAQLPFSINLAEKILDKIKKMIIGNLEFAGSGMEVEIKNWLINV